MNSPIISAKAGVLKVFSYSVGAASAAINCLVMFKKIGAEAPPTSSDGTLTTPSKTISKVALLLCCFCSTLVVAHSHDPEPALAITADDTSLDWGPCPPFMPEGCAIAVLHGDPAKDNVDVFFRLPALSPLPRHWHTSAERMVLVAGELHVTYDGQKTAVLKPGSYAYGPATRPHDGRCASDVPCVLFIAFESPLDAIAGAPAAR